jgi:hypothetical protein
MRKLSPILLALFATAVLGQTSPDDVARRTIDNLAGAQWESSRYFAFSFDVERDGKIVASYPQRWDRYTGDYRVSGKDREGHDILVVMNVNTKAGHAWKDGTEVADPKDLLSFGYKRFINDTYWLLMPLKAMDPGVHREIAPERTDACGHAQDVVHLSFDAGVGLTPADNYWMVVNRDSGLVDEWDMKLTGSKPEDEPLVVLFHDYRRIGGLLLSVRREMKGKGQTIKLDDVTVSHDVPAGAFSK